MNAVSMADAEAILADRSVIAVGVRGDDERRRRHGTRTTFVRVFEVHTDALRLADARSGQAVASLLPAGVAAGEIRIVGKPASVEDAVSAVRRAVAGADTIPLTAYSLADLLALCGGRPDGLADLAGRLVGAGLTAIAEAPIDLLPDAVAMVQAVRQAGLGVPRLSVHQPADDPLRLVTLAREIQSSVGGVRAFAPLPRVQSIAQPTTGYDDVRHVAVSRLMLDNIESIQVDWGLYGPKLAQVALTMGADDVDNVSPLEGDLGRRRSPLEEIKGNVTAAGLEPVERDGAWNVR